MKTLKRHSHIYIDMHSLTPKYVQITNSVVHAIKTGAIKKNHLLPTINELSDRLSISRDTAERGYRQLKKMGVVQSVPGKGYFISSTTGCDPLKMVFFFHRLDACNKMVYASFSEALGKHVGIEYCVHGGKGEAFAKMVNERKTGYAWYVIVPQFSSGGKKAQQVINGIAKNKRILLDKKIPLIDLQCTRLYLNILKRLNA